MLPINELVFRDFKLCKQREKERKRKRKIFKS